MSAKPVQISIDDALLERIDADPEARERGRSAFVRAAVHHYLAAKERREVEARLRQAYEGRADSMVDEIAELIGTQRWPAR
jgi:metal-responsive CopG/Arc/MetJ family transcriptional regulator